jgi:hypothetical protein
MKEAGFSEDKCFSEPKLKSPAQLDKLGKAAKAAVKTVTYIPKGELTVAPMSDPRDAVDPSEGLDLFEDGDEPELLES